MSLHADLILEMGGNWLNSFKSNFGSILYREEKDIKILASLLIHPFCCY
jgi:hypothetical protein